MDDSNFMKIDEEQIQVQKVDKSKDPFLDW